MRKLKNRVIFTIKGLNQERELNKLSKTVNLYCLHRKDKRHTTFEVDREHEKYVKSQLISSGIEVLEKKEYGLFAFLKKGLLNYGILAGIIFSIVFGIVQSFFILQIKVFGIERLSANEVISFTEEILPNKFKHSVDLKSIERELKNHFVKISSVSVAVVGQSLLISINEAIIPDEMIGEFDPIISNVEGRIKSIELMQGTLNVKVGDIIRKGQVLVSPFIFDTDGKRRDVKPAANIEAEVWFTGTSSHNESYIHTFRTGNKVEESDIYLWGMKLYSFTPKVHYEIFEKEESSKFLTKDLILPFKINKTVYYELGSQLIEKSWESVKEEKIEEAKQNCLTFLDENEIIEEENCIIKTAAGITNVSYIITVLRNIGG